MTTTRTSSPLSLPCWAPAASITFSLLKSRWTTPARWAAPIAAAIARTIGSAAAGENGPPSRKRCARLTPAISSMVMNRTSGPERSGPTW